MKTFKDLEFEPHENGYGEHATMDFENGYGVSVVTGLHIYYTDDSHPYELAIVKDGSLCYNSGITEDVLGHLTSRSITLYMKKVQLLKK